MINLKARNPNLKVILAVGGWNHGTARFIRVADNPALLDSFAKNSVSYLKKFQFDGLDVDWEFPTSKSQFSRFIRVSTLRACIRRDCLPLHETPAYSLC